MSLEPRTPFLRVDPPRLERNISAMAAKALEAGAVLHPHAKTHKSLAIARMQLAAGAGGVTASKPSEAMVFIRAGLPAVTVAYPLVDSAVVTELIEAAATSGTELRLIAAHPAHVAAIETGAQGTGQRAGVFVKIDTGLGRVGVPSEGPLLTALAERLAQARGLGVLGVLSHAGHAYGAGDEEQRNRIVTEEMADLRRALAGLAGSGAGSRISVGSTPTCLGALIAPGSDELRPGNYAFLDMTAVRLGICQRDDIALTVESRVVFHSGRTAVIDAGSKILSSDAGPHGFGAGQGFGEFDASDGTRMRVARLSEEHGTVEDPEGRLAVGDRISIRPNHSCATVALASGLQLGGQAIANDARGCLT